MSQWPVFFHLFWVRFPERYVRHVFLTPFMELVAKTFPFKSLLQQIFPSWWTRPSGVIAIFFSSASCPEARRLHWFFPPARLSGCIISVTPHIRLGLYFDPVKRFSHLSSRFPNFHVSVCLDELLLPSFVSSSLALVRPFRCGFRARCFSSRINP